MVLHRPVELARITGQVDASGSPCQGGSRDFDHSGSDSDLKSTVSMHVLHRPTEFSRFVNIILRNEAVLFVTTP